MSTVVLAPIIVDVEKLLEPLDKLEIVLKPIKKMIYLYRLYVLVYRAKLYQNEMSFDL